MQGFVAGKVQSQLQRVRNLSRDTNVFYTAVSLLSQFSVAFFIAAITPLVVRRIILPSSIRNEFELNLSFNTCGSDLHGVCSFPTASVEYDKGTLFSPSVTYALSVRLRFADLEQGQKLGIFQNVVKFYDEDKLLKSYSKASYLKEPRILTKIMWVILFPLYFCGVFHDYNFLEIPLTQDHIELGSQLSTRLVYQLEDRFALIDSAVLVIDARFGLIRHLLYNWPITTSVIMFSSSLAACSIFIILYWGTRSLAASSQAGDSDIVGSPTTRNQPEEPPSKPAIKEIADDEYIPDNVDEVPSSGNFTQIPGWNTQPVLEEAPPVDPTSSIRRRKL
ncbi:hypothetical protein Q1695_001869 [Nippostrongylus brasiliensis]|nr:hypothetical protein Q1695_001869 [Nippostrongylus brasiliensis]